ncbi:MAG: ATP-binding domain-containing protein [Clostridiaceae bacterium]|nr:ATP-binding domain-containing protein [Clostridiaceae bacterium]
MTSISNSLNKNGLKSYVAKRNNWEFNNRIAVTSYHQIKGLQFDYVFILGINEFENIGFSNKDNVLYMTVTRAQKRVFINCLRAVPKIIQKVDKDFYELY